MYSLVHLWIQLEDDACLSVVDYFDQFLYRSSIVHWPVAFSCSFRIAPFNFPSPRVSSPSHAALSHDASVDSSWLSLSRRLVSQKKTPRWWCVGKGPVDFVSTWLYSRILVELTGSGGAILGGRIAVLSFDCGVYCKNTIVISALVVVGFCLRRNSEVRLLVSGLRLPNRRPKCDLERLQRDGVVRTRYVPQETTSPCRAAQLGQVGGPYIV